METKKTAIFFRVDHPTLKSVVESFGDEVNEEEIKVVGHKTRELIDSGIIDYGLGYDICMEGSVRFAQLLEDKRYIQKTYYIPVRG